MPPDNSRRLVWLEQQCELIARLENRLSDERAALLNRETAELNQISADKTGLLQQLADVASQLPQRLGITLDAASVEQWLANETDAALRTAWSQFATGLDRCRQANEANGALLAGRFAQIEASLRYLREAVGSVVYGASGVQRVTGLPQSIARA